MTDRPLMPLAIAAFALLVTANYALSPAHRIDPAELAGYLLPRHGSPQMEVFVDGWLGRAGAALPWLLLNAALLGAGATAARWLGPAPRRLVLRWLLGVAPLGLALLGLGLCGLFSRGVMLALLAGPAAAALAGKPWRAAARADRSSWLAVAPCLLALPGALAPEIGFDALRYHLALPDLYLGEHKVFHVDRFLFSSYPGTAEMLYAAALALGTTVTAKLLAWEAFALAAWQVHALLRVRMERAAAAWLAAAFAAVPFLAAHAATAGVDQLLLCVELAAFAILLERLLDARRGREAAAGWLLGTAMGLKYLGAYALAAVLAAYGSAAALDRRAGAAAALRFLRRALPLAAAVPVAWGVKNWLMTGNPVYPYVFGHWQLEAETFRLHLLWAQEWREAHHWLAGWFTLGPAALTRGLYDAYGEAMAPYLFALPALYAAARKPLPLPERWLAALTAALLLIWSRAGGGIFRYLAPFYPAATVLVGWLLARAPGLAPGAVRAALALGLAVQAPIAVTALYRLTDPSSLMTGAESARDYLRRVLPPANRYLGAVERACKDAAGGRVYMLGDPKAFYAPGRCLTEFEFAPPLLHVLARTSSTPERMRVRLRQRGLALVLYRAEAMVSLGRMSGAVLAPAPLARLQAFWRDYADPLWTGEHPRENAFLHAYALRRAPAAFAPPASGLWYTIPSTEYLTQESDFRLDDGDLAGVERAMRAVLRRHPGFAPAWFRLWVVGRKAGRPALARRAEGELRRLGFGALLDRGV